MELLGKEIKPFPRKYQAEIIRLSARSIHKHYLIDPLIDPKVVNYHIKYQYELCFYLELFMADGNDRYLQIRWQFLLADSMVNGVMN